MSLTSLAITALSDSELLQQVRDGHDAGFTELYMRHHGVARRIAATYRYPGDPDDLVNEAFEKVYAALRRGSGPSGSFRAYLFVTMRHLAAERTARHNEQLLDELPEPVEAVRRAPALDGEERDIIVEAFESLPERSQAVLWYTAVEGRHPRELSSRLGMTANAVSALAYRAREQLRQAYLQAHLRTARPQCEPHRSGLGAFVRDGQSRRDRARTQQHVEHCPSCRGLVAELNEVNRLLVRAVAPLFLAGSLSELLSGSVGATAVSGAATSAVSAAGSAGNAALGGTESVRRLPTALGWAKGAAGTAGAVAAAAAVVSGLFATGSLLSRDQPDRVTLRPAATETSSAGSSTTAPSLLPGMAGAPSGNAAQAAAQPCTSPASSSAEGAEAAAGAPATTSTTAERRSTTGLSVDVPLNPGALAPVLGGPVATLAPVVLGDLACTLDEATGSGQLTLSLANSTTTQSSTTASSAPLVDLDLAGVELKVALTDGVLALDAQLPAGCEIADGGHSVSCTVDEELLGSDTTVGLELLGGSDQLATVTLERDGQVVDVRAVELLNGLAGTLGAAVAPNSTNATTGGLTDLLPR